MAKPPKQRAVAHAVGAKPGRKNSLPSLLRQTKGSGTGAARLIPFKQRTHVAPKEVPPPFTTLLTDQRDGVDQISDLTDPPMIHNAPPPIEEILPSHQSATSSLSHSSRGVRKAARTSVPADSATEPVWGNEKKVNMSILGTTDQTLLSTLDKTRVPKTPKTSTEKKSMSLTGRVSVLTPSPVTLSRVVVQQPLQTFQPRASPQQMQQQREAMKSPLSDAAIQDDDLPSPGAQNELKHQLSPQTDASVVLSNSMSENDFPLRGFDDSGTVATKAIRTGENNPGKKVAFSKVKALLSRVGKKLPPSEPPIVGQTKSPAVRVAGVPVVPSYEPRLDMPASQPESTREEATEPMTVTKPMLKVKTKSPDAMRFGPASPSLKVVGRTSLSQEPSSPAELLPRYGSPERASRLPPQPESPIRILRLQPQTDSPEHDMRSFQESPERRTKSIMHSPRSPRGLDPDDDTSPTKPGRVPVDAPEVAVAGVGQTVNADSTPMESGVQESIRHDFLEANSGPKSPQGDLESGEIQTSRRVALERSPKSYQSGRTNHGPINDEPQSGLEALTESALDVVPTMSIGSQFQSQEEDEKSHLSVQGIPVIDCFSEDEEFDGTVDDKGEEIADDESEAQEDLEHNPFVNRTSEVVARDAYMGDDVASQPPLFDKLSSNNPSKVSVGGTSLKAGPSELNTLRFHPFQNVDHTNSIVSGEHRSRTPGNLVSTGYNDEDDEEEIDVFEAVAFSRRKGVNPFDEDSDEEGIPEPKAPEVKDLAPLKSALKVKNPPRKSVRSVGPLAERTDPKQDLKKKAELKASKHRDTQQHAARIDSSVFTSPTIKDSAAPENALRAGLAFLPNEVMMDDTGTISDLDQSLRHFPLRLVEAADRSIDISGLGHTRDAEETISTRASFEEVIDRYTVSPTQELLRLRTKGVNFAEDGKTSPALADSITESDNTPPPSNVPDVPLGLLNTCESSFMGQAWMTRLLVRPNEKATGNIKLTDAVNEPMDTTDNVEMTLANYPMKEAASVDENNSSAVSFHVEPPPVSRIASIPTFYSSNEDESEVTFQVQESLKAPPHRSHYEETPRISNEASRAPDADGALVGGGSIVAIRSSDSKAYKGQEMLEPIVSRASIDKGRHFFNDHSQLGGIALIESLAASPEVQGGLKRSKLSPSSDVEAMFDRYHAISETSRVEGLGLARSSSPDAETLKEPSGLQQNEPSMDLSSSNAEAAPLVQATSRASFLERLFAFGQEAVGMSSESKQQLQNRMQQMSPTSKMLVEKSIQKAEIESVLSLVHDGNALPAMPTMESKDGSAWVGGVSSVRDTLSKKNLQYDDRVLQLRTSRSTLFPGWSASLGGSHSNGESGNDVSSFGLSEGVFTDIEDDRRSTSFGIKRETDVNESPSDQGTWFSLRDEWKQLHRELEGSMKIVTGKSRDTILALLHETASTTNPETKETTPPSDAKDNARVEQDGSLEEQVDSDVLIDLTAIGSYEDLRDEEAVWLFDLAKARRGQDVLSCVHLESLMEFAAEKLSLLPPSHSPVPKRKGQELKQVTSSNDPNNDAAMSPLSVLKQPFGLDSLRKIETASDIGNLEEQFQATPVPKTPTTTDGDPHLIGDFCQVSPDESKHELEGNIDRSENNTALQQTGVDSSKQLGSQVDDLLYNMCDEADQMVCTQLGYEIVPVGAEAVMAGIQKVTVGDNTTSKAFVTSPSTTAGDRYDSIGTPPDKYDTFDDVLRRTGSDAEMSSGGSSVSSNDGFATILEKMKRDLGESTMRVVRNAPAPANQEQAQSSRQVSPVSKIVPRRDFLDILFDGTLICGTDKQIEMIHSEKTAKGRQQRRSRKLDEGIHRRVKSDDSRSISLSLSPNPRINYPEVGFREQLESPSVRDTTSEHDANSTTPKVELQEVETGMSEAVVHQAESSGGEDQVISPFVPTEPRVVPSTPEDGRECVSPIDKNGGQKGIRDRIAQLCDTISDGNETMTECGVALLRTEVVSPSSPKSRARVHCNPLDESNQNETLHRRVNKLCHTISDSNDTIVFKEKLSLQPKGTLSPSSTRSSVYPINPIGETLPRSFTEQLVASSIFGLHDDASTTGTTGIAMNDENVVSPYVTDVVKDVLFSLGSDISGKSTRSATTSSHDKDVGKTGLESATVSCSERASQPKRAPKPENFIPPLANQIQEVQRELPGGDEDIDELFHASLAHGRAATDTTKSASRAAPKPENFFDRATRPPDILCIEMTKRQTFTPAATADKIETLRFDDVEIGGSKSDSKLGTLKQNFQINGEPVGAKRSPSECSSPVESVVFHSELKQQTVSSGDNQDEPTLDRPVSFSSDDEFTSSLMRKMILSDGQDETTVGPSAALMFSNGQADEVSHTVLNHAGIVHLDSISDDSALNSQTLARLTSMIEKMSADGDAAFGNISTVVSRSNVSTTEEPLESDSNEDMQLSGSSKAEYLSEVSTLNSQAFAGLTDLLEKLSSDKTNDSFESNLHDKSNESSEPRESSGSIHHVDQATSRSEGCSRYEDQGTSRSEPCSGHTGLELFRVTGASGDEASGHDFSIASVNDFSRRENDAATSETDQHQEQASVSNVSKRDRSQAHNVSTVSLEEITEENSCAGGSEIAFPEAFAVLSPRQSYSGDLFEVTQSVLEQKASSPRTHHAKLSKQSMSPMSSQGVPSTLTIKVAGGKERNLPYLLGSRPETPIVIHETEQAYFAHDLLRPSTVMMYHSDVRLNRNSSVPTELKGFDFSCLVTKEAADSAALPVRGTPLVLGVDVDVNGQAKLANALFGKGDNNVKTSVFFEGDRDRIEGELHRHVTPSVAEAITGVPLVQMETSNVGSASKAELASWMPVVPSGDFRSKDDTLRWVRPLPSIQLSTNVNNVQDVSDVLSTDGTFQWNRQLLPGIHSINSTDNVVRLEKSDEEVPPFAVRSANVASGMAPLFPVAETTGNQIQNNMDDSYAHVGQPVVDFSRESNDKAADNQADEFAFKEPDGHLSKHMVVAKQMDQNDKASVPDDMAPFDFVERFENMRATPADDRGDGANASSIDVSQLASFVKEPTEASETSQPDSHRVCSVINVESESGDEAECRFPPTDPDVIVVESSSHTTTAPSRATQARVVKGSSCSLATESMIESDSKSLCGSKVSDSVPREISVTTRVVYGIEVETDDPISAKEKLNAARSNEPLLLSQTSQSPTAYGLVPSILASLGLSRGSDWSECNPIKSLANALEDDQEIDDGRESTSLLLALTRSETTDSHSACSSYDDSRFAIRDERSSIVESSGLMNLSQSSYRCKIDRLRGIAKRASKLSEERKHVASVQALSFDDAHVPTGHKEFPGSPLLSSLLRRLTKQGSDSHSSREAEGVPDTERKPQGPLPGNAEKVKQGDMQSFQAPPDSIVSSDETDTSTENEEAAQNDVGHENNDHHDHHDHHATLAKIPHSVEIPAITRTSKDNGIGTRTAVKATSVPSKHKKRDDAQKAPYEGNEEPAIIADMSSSDRCSSSEDNRPLHSVDVVKAPPPKSSTKLSHVMDRLQIISEKSDSFSFTSTDVEPLDVEELFHRYDNIVKHMVVLDEDRLAKVQSKQKEASNVGAEPISKGKKHSMTHVASVSRSPTSRLAALTVGSPVERHSRRTSFDFHANREAFHSPAVDENQEILTESDPEHIAMGPMLRQRLDRLKLQKSQSTGIRSSASADSSHLSQKARDLRKQLENALQQSAVIRSSQEKLGHEITTFKQKIQDRRAASPQRQPLLAATSPTSTKSTSSRPSKTKSTHTKSNTAEQDVDFQSSTIANAIQCLTIESSDSCMTEKSPIDRIRERHARHVRDSPTSQQRQRARSSPRSSGAAPSDLTPPVPSSIVTSVQTSDGETVDKTSVQASDGETVDKDIVDFVQSLDEDTEMQYSDDEGEDHVVQLQQIESIVSGLFRTESTNSQAAADKPKLSEKLASPRLKRSKSKSPSYRLSM